MNVRIGEGCTVNLSQINSVMPFITLSCTERINLFKILAILWLSQVINCMPIPHCLPQNSLLGTLHRISCRNQHT
jgi:hypothetical protein